MALDSGTANTYVATPSPAWDGYTFGDKIVVQVINANTDASTLNVSGLGAISIIGTDGFPISSGTLAQYGYYTFFYNGGGFVPSATIAPYYYGVNSGAADAYVVTTTTPMQFPALFDGLTVTATIGNTNTGATATLNLDGLGATDIAGTNGSPGVLVGGNLYTFTYNGSTFSFSPALPIFGVQPGQINGDLGMVIIGDGTTNVVASPAIVFGSSVQVDDASSDSLVFGDTISLATAPNTIADGSATSSAVLATS